MTPLGRMHPGSQLSSVEMFHMAASEPEQGPELDRGASDTEHLWMHLQMQKAVRRLRWRQQTATPHR
jgi:hypothetical protein